MPPRRRGPLLLAAALLALPVGGSGAQEAPRASRPAFTLSPEEPGGASFDETVGILLAADLDDEDENGVPDAQQRRPPPGGLRELLLEAPASQAVRLRVEGPVRIVFRGRAVGQALAYRFAEGEPRRLRFALQGTAPTTAAGEAALHVSGVQARASYPVTVVALRLLRGDGRPLDPLRGALGVSHAVTHDATLPREAAWDTASPDPENVRVEVLDPRRPRSARALLRSLPAAGGPERHRTAAWPLRAGPPEHPSLRGPWLRLVGDQVDAEAPGVGGLLLRVALRDVVEAVYEAPGGPVRQRWRVGRPGREDGPRAARRARLRVRVLRLRPGGPPVVGDGSEQEALRIARRQVAVASEVWLQCFLDFGPPEEADVAVVDPPPPALLSISDGEGLPAAGRGEVVFRAGDRRIGPLRTRPGERPVQLALRIAERLRRAGLRPRVLELPATGDAGQRAADVYVRDARGRPVALAPDGERPLSTDARQRVRIGRVDLSDGLDQFDNSNNSGGTLEERALLYGVVDEDPRTLDVVIVDRFAGGGRLGEAFIEMDGGPIVNAVVLDRNGVRTERAAWTLAHELGHVLLDHPLHPDQVGPDRPWLLMDADVSRARVDGPKRLMPEECARFRARSGVGAVPPLVAPHPN